jgi:uncharacterized protein YhaN
MITFNEWVERNNLQLEWPWSAAKVDPKQKMDAKIQEIKDEISRIRTQMKKWFQEIEADPHSETVGINRELIDDGKSQVQKLSAELQKLQSSDSGAGGLDQRYSQMRADQGAQQGAVDRLAGMQYSRT